MPRAPLATDQIGLLHGPVTNARKVNAPASLRGQSRRGRSPSLLPCGQSTCHRTSPSRTLRLVVTPGCPPGYYITRESPSRGVTWVKCPGWIYAPMPGMFTIASSSCRPLDGRRQSRGLPSSALTLANALRVWPCGRASSAYDSVGLIMRPPSEFYLVYARKVFYI